MEFFVKRGRNVELTKYGQLFLPYVQRTLETLETGITTLADYINPNTGTVVMAGFPSLAQFAPDIIVRYVSETNRVDVRLQFNQEATYTRLKEQLLAGAVDLIFATRVDDPRVDASYIGEHQIVLLVPLSHRLARYDEADLRELDGEDCISFDTDCQLRGVTDYLRPGGRRPRGRHHPLPSGRHPLQHQDSPHLQRHPAPAAVPPVEQGAVSPAGGGVLP